MVELHTTLGGVRPVTMLGRAIQAGEKASIHRFFQGRVTKTPYGKVRRQKFGLFYFMLDAKGQVVDTLYTSDVNAINAAIREINGRLPANWGHQHAVKDPKRVTGDTITRARRKHGSTKVPRLPLGFGSFENLHFIVDAGGRIVERTETTNTSQLPTWKANLERQFGAKPKPPPVRTLPPPEDEGYKPGPQLPSPPLPTPKPTPVRPVELLPDDTPTYGKPIGKPPSGSGPRTPTVEIDDRPIRRTPIDDGPVQVDKPKPPVIIDRRPPVDAPMPTPPIQTFQPTAPVPRQGVNTLVIVGGLAVAVGVIVWVARN